MTTEAHEDDRMYVAVKNHEEQYSIWLADKELPPGWVAVGDPGPRDECLTFIKEVWTDITPASLRRQD